MIQMFFVVLFKLKTLKIMAQKKTTTTTKRTIYRSAEDGKIVTKEYAEKHPNITVKETIKVNKPK
ncbi:hypothetical protein ASG22_03995 [Chryseobacterium sp. Leaf405]|nr:hypothetical protein ASG22_03995 [Chryseobacterium sp. Leaf405]